jgi:hypothetical protein
VVTPSDCGMTDRDTKQFLQRHASHFFTTLNSFYKKLNG